MITKRYLQDQLDGHQEDISAIGSREFKLAQTVSGLLAESKACKEQIESMERRITAHGDYIQELRKALGPSRGYATCAERISELEEMVDALADRQGVEFAHRSKVYAADKKEED